jgi:hypothetical protein
MKRLLLWLLILTALAWAGYKGGVWWFADQRMNEARLALNHYGVLERGAIHSTVRGRLLLKGSQWQDFRLTQPLAVPVAELTARSPVSLINLLYAPAAAAAYTLKLEGLGLALDATMFRKWVTAQGANSEGEAALFALSCAPDPRQRLSSGDLIRMGIGELTGAALLRQNEEGFYAELTSDELGSVELNWPTAQVDWRAPQEALARGSLDIILRDGGVMRRVAAWCAREAGLSTEQWAGRSVAQLRLGLRARGWLASSQLLALYRQWLLKGGELQATLRLAEPALGLPIYTEQTNASSRLGAAVYYNDASVPDVFLLSDSDPSAAPQQPVSTAQQPQTVSAEGWLVQPVAAAEQWLGQKVRITLRNNKRVAGRLVRVTVDEIEVARLVAGGEVAYPMQRVAVAGLEVWRRNRALNSNNND